MEKATIASESRRVVDLFQSLTLETDGLVRSGLSEVEDQSGRFNIFARNVGVFAAGHASLDYRLRQNEDAQKVALQLLQSLQQFLQQAIEASGNSELEFENSPSLSDLDSSIDDGAGSTFGSEVSFDTSAASTMDAEELREKSAATDHFSGVEETIDRLYRMSYMIRTPSVASQNARANAFRIMDEDGNDGEPVFREFAVRVVESRCPEASPGLVSKISESIVLRRKRFLYRGHHQHKLSSGPSKVQLTASEGRSHRAPSAITVIRKGTEPPTPNVTAQPKSKAHGTAPSATSASGFSNTCFRPGKVFEARSVASTAAQTIDDRADAFQPPPPPKAVQGGKEFECPYCYLVLPITEARPSKWKQHFLKDLDPFVCLFPGCEDRALLFGDTKSWMAHMESGHARQWCCRAPNCSKERHSTEDAFADHMRSHHKGAFAENQLPMLKRRAEVPGVAFKTCPFCAFAPEAAVPDSGLQSSELVLHVANHLKDLALISLPEDDKDEDSESHGTASHKANESTGGDEGEMLENLPSLSSQSETAPSQDMAEVVLKVEELMSDEHVEPGSRQDEWGFIEETHYQGHDRDPTLQKFLRKLYLESSPYMPDTKGPALPCWYVPLAKNTDFFGRESVLEKAANTIVPSAAASNLWATDKVTNPRTFEVYGPGGMGKTQVAVEFVHRHKQEFDAVLWAHGDDASKLAQDFNAMALRLGLVAADSIDAQDQVHTRELVKRWLIDPVKDLNDKDSGKASWLLVFDAVQDARVLNDFWPYDGPGSILITSRSSFAWATSRPLAPFSAEEASRYLLKLTGRDRDKEDVARAHDVSEKLGGLPLALTQMAGLINHQKLSFDEFARAYDKRESRQQMLESAPALATQPSWYEHSVASVWALDNLKHGLTLLNTLSMLDSSGISEKLYTETFGKIDLPGLPRSSSEYQQAKAELLESSLIVREKASGKFRVHGLVQEVARMRLGPMQYRETFMASVHLVSELWRFENFGWRHDVGRWAACGELFPHVQTLRDLAVVDQLFPSTEDWEGDYEFARLLTDAGWYHHERGRSVDAWRFNDVAQHIGETWVKRLPKPQQSEGDAQDKVLKLNAMLAEIVHNRGCISTETNRPRLAFTYFEDFNAKMMRDFEVSPELVTQDMRLAISWNELGIAHMLNERWQEGERCFNRSIVTMRLLDKFEQTTLSLPLVNLGLACWLQGRSSDALDILTRGLEDREEAYKVKNDSTSFITGRFLHALGNVMASMKDHEQSHEYHRRALFQYKTTLGLSHHRTADVFVKLSEHSMHLGHWDTALALLDHALEVYNYRDVGARETTYLPEKARVVFKRSQVLRSKRKVEEANEELEEAATLREHVLEAAETRDAENLTAVDFDDLVAFWSK